MSQPELLKTVVEFLEQAGIEYMLTGSLVSSLQGEPRATHDIDLVVEIDQPDVERLLRAFPPPRYYVSESAARDAIRRHGTFNLLDTVEGDKVDFWLLADEPFNRSRFSRRYVEVVVGTRILVSTPEDTILAKLRWTKLSGGSEKHFTDALRVYELQYGTLDLEYLRQWVQELGLQDLWARTQQEAHPLQ